MIVYVKISELYMVTKNSVNMSNQISKHKVKNEKTVPVNMEDSTVLKNETEINEVLNVKELQERRDVNLRRRKDIRLEITKLMNELRDIDKSDYQIESLLLREVKRKRKRVISTKTLEALGRPMELVPEFCDFLNVPHGTLMPRSEAKNRVHKYLIEKNLRIEKDKRYFFLDEQLQNLFDHPEVPNLDEVTLKKLALKSTNNLCGYFYMQKYLNRLFVKRNESESVAVNA